MSIKEICGHPIYIIVALSFGFLSGISYFISRIVKLHKRPGHIENFLQHLEKGSKTVSMEDVKEYKLKIPLLVVNLNTGAVTSLHVPFQNTNKPFIIPVPVSYIESMKEILVENS